MTGKTHRSRSRWPTCKKVLGSVAQMVDAGNRVVFDDTGSYIHNKASGKNTTVHRRNGVYVFDLWVPPLAGTDFVRQDTK